MRSLAGACSKKMMLECVLFSEVIFWISLSKLDNTTKYSFSWSAAILTIKTVPSFRPKLYSDTRQPRDAGNRKAGAGSEYFRSSLFPSPLRHHQFPVAGHSSRVHRRGFSTRASYLLTLAGGKIIKHILDGVRPAKIIIVLLSVWEYRGQDGEVVSILSAFA